jgi:hypothetical protein
MRACAAQSESTQARRRWLRRAALCSRSDTVAREGEHGVFRPQQRLGAGSNQGDFVDDRLALRSVAPDADVLPWFGLQSRFCPGRPDRPDRTWDAGRPHCIDAHARNLMPAHGPIAAALHANAANIEAVMIAGQWRKREHSLLVANLDELKSQLVESGERPDRGLEPAVSICSVVRSRRSSRSSCGPRQSRTGVFITGSRGR